MKRIQVLDNHTCNQIAAGEVVERPSSVVKELVENSIDANSKNIRVELIDGGHKSIKVIDDGDGIHPEDIETAFMTHATSKIRGIDDIYNVLSLGFRGEALPSIASIAKVSLSSKCDDQEMGKEIKIEGGAIVHNRDIGRGKGTTMEVADIFFNVPARQKFLKTASKEGAAVNDLLMRLAVCNPGIAFSFFRDGKKVFATKGSGDLNETVRSIYGKETAKNVISFENQNEYSTIHGYIGNESLSRGSRSRQTIFVNGRYIKNPLITTAVEKAFKSFLTINKFPFFVLFINIAPDIIDVNIHPSKSEIKFKEDRGVFKLVFDGVHSALKEDLEDTFLSHDEIQVNNTSLKINEERLSSLSSELESLKSIGEDKYTMAVPIDLKNERAPSKSIFDEPVVSSSKERVSDFSYEPKEYKERESSKREYTPKESTSREYTSRDYSKREFTQDDSYSTPTVSDEEFLFKNEIRRHEQNSIDESVFETVVEDTDTRVSRFEMPRIIGQYDKTYILAELNKVLYIIDQHAAHEKILFEKYSKAMDVEDVASQILIVPVLINLTPDEFSCFEENLDLFSKAGFSCEDFGGNTISIREIPLLFKSINVEDTFMSFLADFINMGEGIRSNIKFDALARNACRKAVKANDVLNHLEMEHLIEELRFIDEPFTCPHGRPTIIKFTTYEVEKMFKRIQ